jgi:hypothetical protein
MNGEVGVQTGKASEKVIFPNSDRSLGGVLTMVVRGDKLEFDVSVTHEFFEGRRAFIIQLLKLGFESSISEVLVHSGIGSQDFTFGAVLMGSEIIAAES